MITPVPRQRQPDGRVSGTHRRSPEVKARVPAELRDRLKQEAESRGTTTSELVREALTQYLAS